MCLLRLPPQSTADDQCVVFLWLLLQAVTEQRVLLFGSACLQTVNSCSSASARVWLWVLVVILVVGQADHTCTGRSCATWCSLMQLLHVRLS